MVDADIHVVHSTGVGTWKRSWSNRTSLGQILSRKTNLLIQYVHSLEQQNAMQDLEKHPSWVLDILLNLAIWVSYVPKSRNVLAYLDQEGDSFSTVQ
jgi:hypothetical protein